MPFPKQRIADGNENLLRNRVVLKSVTESSLNAAAIPRRKRKHSSISGHDGLGEEFIIRPQPSSSSNTSVKLRPHRLIPRSSLPLSYLDFETHHNAFSSTRLFSARIAALESQKEQPCNTMVLIAELDWCSTLYAVEKVQTGIYALCKLCKWVKLDSFIGQTAHPSKIQDRSRKQTVVENQEWWRSAAIEVKPVGDDLRPKRRRTDSHGHIQLSLKPPPVSVSQVAPTKVPRIENVQGMLSTPNTRNSVENTPRKDSLEINPKVVLSTVGIQYQEMLYLSKASLAYFVKGPLSRARAVFQREDTSSAGIDDLIQSLKSILLSLKVIDKKYREILPNILKEIPAGIVSEEESSQIQTLLGDKIRKSKKRKKVGKEGLHPGEEEYVARWWISRDKSVDVGGPFETREEEIRTALVEQRARETKLQLILILEILALEASTTNVVTHHPSQSDLPQDDERISATKVKANQPHELGTLLNLLIDRLCIWQSMSVEAGLSITESDRTSSHRSMEHAPYHSNSERLKEFCVEVVIPFYVSRLPDICSSICQKFGRPLAPSPPRPQLCKRPSSSQAISNPGGATHRFQQRRPRRTLERVLTDEKMVSRRPPAPLLRSATDSILPSLKREPSEVSLSAIPMDRPKLHNLKRYSQREVDLIAASHATEAKLQKKASLEQELKGAIAALKKPNPRMAVKDLVESAERRAAVGVTKSRKSKNPVRNPFAQGVQVMATPRVNRLKDVFSGLPRLPGPSNFQTEEPEVIPPSSDPRIPSSSMRSRAIPVSVQRRSAIIGSTVNRLPPTFQSTIEQTPTRRGTKHTETQLGHEDDNDDLGGPSPPELPSLKATQYSLNQSQPATKIALPNEALPQRRVMHITPVELQSVGSNSSISRGGIQNSPVQIKAKETSIRSPDGNSQRLLSPPNIADAGKSIYERLGWDNNDIDELS